MPAPVTYPAPAEPSSDPLRMPEAEYLDFIQTRTIGGSQAGMILGLSEYGGPADAWDRILGVVPPSPTNPDMERGQCLEDVVASVYTERTGRQLSHLPVRVPHPSFPFLHSSPDRLIFAGHGRSSDGILEIKCPRVRGFTRTRTEGVSRPYYAQLQLYMDAWEKSWGSFAIFNAELWDLHWFDVERDDAFVDEMLVQLERFWHEHVLTRVRPGAPRRELVSVPRGLGTDAVFRDDPHWIAAVRALRWARQEADLAERQKKAAEDRVKELMGDCELVIGGGVRVSWKGSTRRSLDEAALRQAHSDLDLEPFRRVTQSRTFRPTFED
jgi:putative phage-type endonuclease